MKSSLRLYVLVAACIFPGTIAADAQSNYEPYFFTTFAGNAGAGSADGTGSFAQFDGPQGAAVDSAGNIYIGDSNNNTIRKVTPAGVVTTIAGLAGASGSEDGTGNAARFQFPAGVAVDGSGNTYVADTANHTIRKITVAGEVTTLAGLAGSSGSDDGMGSAARFDFPYGVAVDAAGNVFVGDSNNHTIREISPAGVVTTLAGLPGSSGSADGTGSAARFSFPRGLAVDGVGNVYVADTLNHTLRKIAPGGVVSTIAGVAGISGSADGVGSAARFHDPRGVTADSAGHLYVADTSNHTVRKITAAGEVSTVAGLPGVFGSSDGTGSAARFAYPTAVAADTAGNIAVADTSNSTVRKITATAVVTTLAGTIGGIGNVDASGRAARFAFPTGITIESAGNIYVSDFDNNSIRKITPSAVVITFAGSGAAGSDDGTGTAARFFHPAGIAVDNVDNIYVADFENSTVRKITPAAVVSTFAGLANVPPGSDDGIGSAARFRNPIGVAVDRSGNIFIGDYGNHTIRKITSAGVVTTFAGLANNPGSTDGTGSAARFRSPAGVAADSAGNVYVADYGNHIIRKITPVGVVTTLAGLAGSRGSADGTGSAARFDSCVGIAVDHADNIFVGDYLNHTIRKITPAGLVTTVAGVAGTVGIADGRGSDARFNHPGDIAFDSAGKMYVTDRNNHTIRAGTVALSLASAVSTKTHNSAGPFDVNLPLTGEPGVECRSSGGNHTLIFTFNRPIVSGSAILTIGVGNISQPPIFTATTMTVLLSGINDVQRITVTLSGVTDALSDVLPDTAVSANMLIGDVTGDKNVNVSDVVIAKQESGRPITSANFRADVAPNGTIGVSDIALVKSHSGASLP